jgi:hypothetical protein
VSGDPFVRRGDEVRFHLHEVERRALVSLIADLDARLASDTADDPVLERLSPRAVLGDADADRDLRATLGPTLRDERRAAFAGVIARLSEAGGRSRVEVRLRGDEPWMLLGVLNDVRLAIGARVGIDDLDRDALLPQDPRARSVGMIDHLGWWQWRLIAVLDPEAAAAAEPREGDPDPDARDPWDALEGPDGSGWPGGPAS